ncbi:MAG TPA: hypothetical protein VFN55_12840 [Solirubrobacteraceae bacterium]|nr:hypothetical protein [Solirubrobacteraceae bacterium]
MEASASAPTHPEIELEPPEWQPRANWVSARLLCGAAAFFFAAFVFAYFYLRSQDSNHDWKIGHVAAPGVLGAVIAVALVVSAVALHAASRSRARMLSAGGLALALALLSIVLQVFAWTELGFGPASGGYASVYIGWTAFYSVMTLACAYWIETQVATAWRRTRHGVQTTPAEVTSDTPTIRSGAEAASFFWSFHVAIGVLMFVVLYLL